MHQLHAMTISTFEETTTMLPQNVGHEVIQSPSNLAPHTRRTETSITLLQNPKNFQLLQSF